MASRGLRRTTLFVGCRPEVAVGGDGRVIATGAAARDAAGTSATTHVLHGRTHPGFGDSHLHLDWMARAASGVELGGAATRREALDRVAAFARRAAPAAWVTGSGWSNDEWSDDPRTLTREELDTVGGGRPVVLTRKDGHSACLSSAALAAVGFTRDTPDAAGGVMDRDSHGELTGMVREQACDAAARAVPTLGDDQFDTALLAVLDRLACDGLTMVHTMDGPRLFSALERIHGQRRLPIRVVWNLPVGLLPEAERLGISSGFGDEWLRIWGVKAFLDGSLGSRTAEMLDGSGVVVTPDAELADIVARCARARLNVCLHAIGDGAVRRALDALEPFANAWERWRPRIEHAQCVSEDDIPRFARLGVIASMQPLHAVSDRTIADAAWGARTAQSYAWGALDRAGATLAFGSDAPVEDPSPMLGLDAATAWRSRAGWHTELALSRAAAIRAYTRGVAYAAGMEREVGALRAGMRADMTVVDGGKVTATVVDGRLAWQRRAA
jgi:predicted amidohydrolase YtcJ